MGGAGGGAERPDDGVPGRAARDGDVAGLRETATSLVLEGVDVTSEDVLEGVLAALSEWLPRPAAEVLDAWRERDALLGRPVRWANGSGVGSGVDETGALLVDTADGRVALQAGEVHLEGMHRPN